MVQSTTPDAPAKPKRAARGTKGEKPPKPDGCPLTPHPNGSWCKKVRRKVYFFGPWHDLPAALQRWEEVKDDLLNGRKPRSEAGDVFDIDECVNRFLEAKEMLVEIGELSHAMWRDYKRVCERIKAEFTGERAVNDLRPDDFARLRVATAKRPGKTGGYGPVALSKFITCVKSVFKWAHDEGHIDRPLSFGATFKRPKKEVIRRERKKQSAKMFEASEIWSMLDKAEGALKPMILLGVNCGLGNADCGTLPMRAVDLDGGWIEYERQKTAKDRRCPLWPETVGAIKAWLKERPAPKAEGDRELLFITKYGGSWFKAESSDNPVSKEMRKLLDGIGIERRGVSFYSLRHVTATIGKRAGDIDALRMIMGHGKNDADITEHYNEERPSDDRLRAVSDTIHKWFLAGKPKKKAKPK